MSTDQERKIRLGILTVTCGILISISSWFAVDMISTIRGDLASVKSIVERNTTIIFESVATNKLMNQQNLKDHDDIMIQLKDNSQRIQSLEREFYHLSAKKK